MNSMYMLLLAYVLVESLDVLSSTLQAGLPQKLRSAQWTLLACAAVIALLWSCIIAMDKRVESLVAENARLSGSAGNRAQPTPTNEDGKLQSTPPLPPQLPSVKIRPAAPTTAATAAGAEASSGTPTGPDTPIRLSDVESVVLTSSTSCETELQETDADPQTELAEVMSRLRNLTTDDMGQVSDIMGAIEVILKAATDREAVLNSLDTATKEKYDVCCLMVERAGEMLDVLSSLEDLVARAPYKTARSLYDDICLKSSAAAVLLNGLRLNFDQLRQRAAKVGLSWDVIVASGVADVQLLLCKLGCLHLQAVTRKVDSIDWNATSCSTAHKNNMLYCWDLVKKAMKLVPKIESPHYSNGLNATTAEAWRNFQQRAQQVKKALEAADLL